MKKSSVTILLIENNQDKCQALLPVLHSAGYQVIKTDTAAEGLAILHKVSPDLVMLEAKLPDRNGFLLCLDIKKDVAIRHIPIVMLASSFSEARDKAFALNSGADGFLALPVDPFELTATLRSLLRMRAIERELRASEERFNLAMEGMNDGLWDDDQLTGQIYYSPRYKAMLGYADDEFPNTREASWEKIHPEDVEKAAMRVEKALAARSRDYLNIFRMRHKNGTWRWIMARGMVVCDQDGQPVRFIGAHTDVTEQKELERELRTAHVKAEAANRAKTNFLANMSHEIRTPMNAIIGLANILTDTALDEKQIRMVKTLSDSAESLLGLLNNVLDITKIEDDMIMLEQTPFSLREVTDRVTSMLGVKAAEKDLALTVNYPDGHPDRFIGDPLRIQQILTNLVSNAIKFTATGGVTLDVIVQPDVHATEDHLKGRQRVTLKVSDTGIGIPEDKLYAVFDKFIQAEHSTTRRYGGSGLGLTICKALAECMHGNIHVASIPGQGSVFTVNLPLLPVAGERPVANDDAASKATDQERGRILLVEDYAPNILVASTVLKALGYSYEVATDGYAAVQACQNEHFHAVLMDIQMPGMDGFEATRQIRAWEQDQHCAPHYIIAMTAHALAGDRDKCLAAGMDDYIAKPFTPDELRDKLETIGAPLALAA